MTKIVEIIKELKNRNVELICLAGYMRLLSKEFVQAFPNKIINIHPALLPKYGGKGMYGKNVHQAVLNSMDKETGITIHYVNEQYDEGEFIFQQKISIEDCNSVEEIASKVQELEHVHFTRIIEKLITHNS